MKFKMQILKLITGKTIYMVHAACNMIINEWKCISNMNNDVNKYVRTDGICVVIMYSR